MQPSKFLQHHYDFNRRMRNTQKHQDAGSFHRSRDKSDWLREKEPEEHTYLSMFGGTYRFSCDLEAERTARELIAGDVAKRAVDHRGMPLALAECARLGDDDEAVFPFFLDADIKTPDPHGHDELVRLARDVVLPAIQSHYPAGAFPDMKLLVCAARAPKDLSYWACPTCGGPADPELRSCCGTTYPEETPDAELRRLLGVEAPDRAALEAQARAAGVPFVPTDQTGWTCPRCEVPVEDRICGSCDGIFRPTPEAELRRLVGEDRADLEAEATRRGLPFTPRSLEHRRLFKTAVHFRVWNPQAAGAEDRGTAPEDRAPVVGSDEAVDITSTIYARIIMHPEFRTWCTPEAWAEACDVAPVKSSVPSLRVLGTVKSVKCVCGGHGEGCILCNGSGKRVDDRPYACVGCVDAAGRDVAPPRGAAALHATSIRVTGAKSEGFRSLEGGVPRLMADDRDVERSRGLLRNPDSDDMRSTFKYLSLHEQKRLSLKPTTRKARRPRGSYRRVDDRGRIAAVETVIRTCVGFGGHYARTVVTALYEQPTAPHRLVAHVDGINSTFCFHRGPDAAGRPRGPGCHGSSRVWFMLDPDRGVRQRCFSEKLGEDATPCKVWTGTPWHDMDVAATCRLWTHKRAEATAPLYRERPKGRGSGGDGGDADDVDEDKERRDAENIARLIWNGIDHNLAMRGLPQLDLKVFFGNLSRYAERWKGNTTEFPGITLENKADEMYALLRKYNLDTPTMAPPAATEGKGD